MGKTRATRSTGTIRFLLSLVALGAASVTAFEVSVCQDATYELAVDAASLCSGAGAEPQGRHCPKAGDVAVDDCLSTLVSFSNGRCVSPEDAVCQVVTGETWGCVLPSLGCNGTAVPSVGERLCVTWDFSSDSSVDGFESGDGHSSEGDESWFRKTTKLRSLYNCGHRPTPAPTARAHRPKIDTTDTNTRNQTNLSASGDNDEVGEETEEEVSTKVKTDRDVEETKTEAEVPGTPASEHRHETGKKEYTESASASADGYDAEEETKTRNHTMASASGDYYDVDQEAEVEARITSASGSGSEQETEEEEAPSTSASGYEAEQETNASTMSGSEDDYDVEIKMGEKMATKGMPDRDEVETEMATKMPTPTHSVTPTVASTVLSTLMPVSSGKNGSLRHEDVLQVGSGELEAGEKETGAGHLTTVMFAAGTPESFGGLSGEALAGIAAAVAFAAVVMTVVAVVYARQRRRLEDMEGEGEVDVEGVEDENEGNDDGNGEDESDETEGNDDGSGKDESEGMEDGNDKDGSEGNSDGSGTRVFVPLVPSTPAVLTGRSATTPISVGAKASVSMTPTATTTPVTNTAENLSATTWNDNALEGIRCVSEDHDDDETALAASSKSTDVVVTDT